MVNIYNDIALAVENPDGGCGGAALAQFQSHLEAQRPGINACTDASPICYTKFVAKLKNGLKAFKTAMKTCSDAKVTAFIQTLDQVVAKPNIVDALKKFASTENSTTDDSSSGSKGSSSSATDSSSDANASNTDETNSQTDEDDSTAGVKLNFVRILLSLRKELKRKPSCGAQEIENFTATLEKQYRDLSQFKAGSSYEGSAKIIKKSFSAEDAKLKKCAEFKELGDTIRKGLKLRDPAIVEALKSFASAEIAMRNQKTMDDLIKDSKKKHATKKRT